MVQEVAIMMRIGEMVQKIVEGGDHHHIWKAEWHGQELSNAVNWHSKTFHSVLEQFLP
ncbi:hypothetical protein PISMIDRAFT_11235 [Pisolithus microcarpus 441]|uniref:Uncharacterized protein n=1 Tax=Pisolithus microcarpus 441 TaxID=765257 RepID=A0A0C9Z1S6_9AGAM|nr:hypothetical protein PISMIDRAFT_11235 [Pisolithus microcarpus 441]